MNPLQKWFFKKVAHKNPIYNKSKIHKIMQKSWLMFKDTYFASLCCLLLMLLFVLLFKIYFASLDFQVSQPTTKKDYWSQTGIDLSTLQSIINQETCYKELVNFLGCMQALTAIVTLQSDKEINLTLTNSQVTKDITHLSDIHIKPLIKRSFRDVNDVLDDFKMSMTEKLRYWEALYKKTQKHPIHFYQILADIITPYHASYKEQKTPHKYWLQGLLEKNFLIKQKPALSYKKLIAQAINSYLSTTHSPHDHLIPLDMVKEHSQISHEEYKGIGLVLFQMQRHLVIKQVLENGPAFHAGLKSGDIISKIQGMNVSRMKFSQPSQVITKILNPKIHIEVFRKGHRKHFQVEKKVIKIDNVKIETLQDRGKKWGMIKISSFYKADTCVQVEKAVHDLQKDPQIAGLVIDLRNNPGGIVDEALCSADLFLPKDRFMLEIRPFHHLKQSQLSFSLLPQLTNLPLVILINAGSASSAEILAGVLRDHNRAVLIGERSFGKGTILQGRLFQYPKYPGLLHYQTFAKFYFPSRRTNHVLGILPDHTVKFQNDSLIPFREEDLFAYRLPLFASQNISKEVKSIDSLALQKRTFRNYQTCLDDLKMLEGQREAKSIAKTMLRCVTAQSSF